MNDDFLYRLRKEPSAAFMARLKARLGRQNARTVRFSIARSFLLALLVGGSAIAATWWMVQSRGTDEPRSTATRAAGSNSSPSPSVSRDLTARQTPFVGRSPVEEASAKEQVRAASPPARTSNSRARSDESAAEEASHGGVIGGYANPSRSGRLARLRSVRAAGHEVGMMLVEAVRKDSSYELELERVDDEEAFQRFCVTEQADLIVTTRSITEGEMRRCTDKLNWKAERIRTMKLGHMGVALSAAKTATLPRLSPREIFLALAKRIPDPANSARFIPNTNRSWHQVGGGYPERRITFFGPERGSPLARVFAALVLNAGCNTFPSIKALRNTDPDEYGRICHEIREDSVYTSVYEGEFFLTQTLWGDPHAIAVLSLPFFDAHRTELNGSLLTGVMPTSETIESGVYEGAVTLFLYARGDTNAAWLARNFEAALEPPSYLASFGLIVDAERQAR